MSRLGPHQLALLSLGAGDLLGAPGTIKEERGPRGGVTRAIVFNSDRRILVPADTLRRLARRGLYQAGKLTEAGLAALAEFRARGGRRT